MVKYILILFCLFSLIGCGTKKIIIHCPAETEDKQQEFMIDCINSFSEKLEESQVHRVRTISEECRKSHIQIFCEFKTVSKDNE